VFRRVGAYIVVWHMTTGTCKLLDNGLRLPWLPFDVSKENIEKYLVLL
jgi:hypothetical protein